MILTVDELRDHITTSLGDTALQRLLDDAEAQIVAFAGAAGSRAELVDGGTTRIAVEHPIGSIASVRERAGTDDVLTLATDDYRQRGTYVLERMRGGTNSWSRWRGTVEVTYTPVDDTATREVVQLELIKLEIAVNPGLASETIGAWTQTYSSIGSKSVPEQRADILSRLREPSLTVV